MYKNLSYYELDEIRKFRSRQFKSLAIISAIIGPIKKGDVLIEIHQLLKPNMNELKN